MYSKFILNDLVPSDYEDCKSIGQKYYEEVRDSIQSELGNFIGIDGTVDGTKLQEEWFPTKKGTFNIFLSHSHADEELAVSLAGYLKDRFNLNVFIDSCLWGYANNLLREIDEMYCRQSNGKFFDYDKRNYSTSHVHMMLASALLRMIDNCEAVFFLNTENSISIGEEIEKERTASPWIYTELAMADRISIRSVQYHRKKLSEIEHRQNELANESVSLKINYHVDRELKKFIPLSRDDIMDWELLCEANKHEGEYALDELYKFKGIQSDQNVYLG